MFTPGDYDGKINNGEGEHVAYWYLNEASDGGYWVSKDGTLTGEWSYDTDTSDSGIWWNDAGKEGTWVQDENDDTLKIGYENIEYLRCIDTSFGLENDNGEPICDQYQNNPSDCELQDSVSISAKEHCCSCGGGAMIILEGGWYGNDGSSGSLFVTEDNELYWANGSTGGTWQFDVDSETSGSWIDSDGFSVIGSWTVTEGEDHERGTFNTEIYGSGTYTTTDDVSGMWYLSRE